MKVLTGVMVLLAVAAMAFAVFQPVQVLPRLRLAPGYALVDQTGSTVTSEDGRGTISLYTFVPLDCGEECDGVVETMQQVGRRIATEVDLGPADFRLVTVVLDADPAVADVRAAADAAGATEDWVWLGASQRQLDNVVGLGFRRSSDPVDFRPSYAIVDGAGLVRGEYRYRTLTGDADKLVRHIGVLGSELRNRSPFNSFVYEAAHAFQCYP